MPRYEYTCRDMRPLTSDTVRGAVFAARVFAHRLIRVRWGRRGKLIELLDHSIPGQRSKTKHYKFTARIGVNGERSRLEELEITETLVPEYTRETAIDSATQLAKETGKDWIAYSLNGNWDWQQASRFNMRRKWLTDAVRINRNGEARAI